MGITPMTELRKLLKNLVKTFDLNLVQPPTSSVIDDDDIGDISINSRRIDLWTTRYP